MFSEKFCQFWPRGGGGDLIILDNTAPPWALKAKATSENCGFYFR